MQNSIKRRFLAYALAVAVLVGASVYKPQRADAVALTSTAAVVALVASVMTACGVTYWANTQSDAVSYLAGEIETYLGTLSETYSSALEWLGINSISDAFAILNGGVLSVPALIANKILDFVSWFNTRKGIQSGGSVVSSSNLILTQNAWGATYEGSLTFTPINGQNIRLNVSGFKKSSQNVYLSAAIKVESNNSYTITCTDSVRQWEGSQTVGSASGTGSFGYNVASTPSQQLSAIGAWGFVTSASFTTSSINQGDYLYLILTFTNWGSAKWSGYIDFNISGAALESNTAVRITPSASVSVPTTLTGTETLDIETSATITDSDTNDEACQAILDAVVSQDGLSSSNTVDNGVSSSWDWLSDILDNIYELILDVYIEISSIPSAIGSQIRSAISGLSTTLSNILTFLQSTITGIGQKVDDVKGAILGLPSSIASALSSALTGIGQKVDDVKSAILGLPSSIASSISTALSAAFVPSQAYIATFVASLYSTFDNHFSILSYPFSLLGTFITKVGTIGSSDPIFTWGNIYEPFSGKLLIAAGSYNLNAALQNQTFAYAHSLYMIVIKGLLSFQFLSFLYAWFCDVFHMKNSDFDSPFDEDGDED